MNLIKTILLLLLLLLTASAFSQTLVEKATSKRTEIVIPSSAGITTQEYHAQMMAIQQQMMQDLLSPMVTQQLGNRNNIQINGQSPNISGQLVQQGNDNSIYSKNYGQETATLNYQQLGNNNIIDQFGTNSIGEKMKINQFGSNQTIIVRNFK